MKKKIKVLVGLAGDLFPAGESFFPKKWQRWKSPHLQRSSSGSYGTRLKRRRQFYRGCFEVNIYYYSPHNYYYNSSQTFFVRL